MTLLLPAQTRHERQVVEDCAWRIATFVRIDAYVRYDYGGNYAHPRSDVVLREHLRAVNAAMLARARVQPWEAYFGQPIAELQVIPPELDLVDGPADEVEQATRALGDLVARLSEARGITDVSASKVLHLLRPGFIAISDSYVRTCLGIAGGQLPVPPRKAGAAGERMVAVQRAMRRLAEANGKALTILARWAATLPDLPPGVNTPMPFAGGPYRGERVPVRLTKIRILDILLWTEVAIHQRHPSWLPLWSERRRRGR